MKKQLIRALRKYQEFFNLYHTDLVHLEGGLGSQILGAIQFWDLQEKIGVEKAKCDLTYFSTNTKTTDLWPYMLDRYGIKISEFEKSVRISKLNLLKAKRDFLHEDQISKGYWINARTRYLNRFNYQLEQTSEYFQQNFQADLTPPYAAIHIRRGDYLQVASKLITIDEYLNLLKSIGSSFPKNVFVLSDSEISKTERTSITKVLGADHLVKYLDSPLIDAFHAHGLLRNSSILITSNSTFSFTAGLLGRSNQKVFSPTNFHSGRNSDRYNRTFSSAGTFFVWSSNQEI
jgi:hypothetical protein